MNRRAYGLRAWVWQRLSAVYMGGYVVYLFAHFALSPPRGFAQWRAWLAETPVSVAAALFCAALLLHAWIGVRDVVMDYVHPLGLRFALLAATALALAACAAWALRILFAPG